MTTDDACPASSDAHLKITKLGNGGCLDEALRLDSEHQILQRGSRKTVDNYKPRKNIVRLYSVVYKSGYCSKPIIICSCQYVPFPEPVTFVPVKCPEFITKISVQLSPRLSEFSIIRMKILIANAKRFSLA